MSLRGISAASFASVVIVAAIVSDARAAEPKTYPLWPESAPGAKGADPKAVLDLYKAYEAYSGNTISLVDCCTCTVMVSSPVNFCSPMSGSRNRL